MLLIVTLAAAPSAVVAQGSAAQDASEATSSGLWDRATLTGDWGGLRTTLLDAGVKFNLGEQSEVWGNLTGGLRRGVVL